MPSRPCSTLRRRAPLLNWLVRWGGVVVCVVVLVTAIVAIGWNFGVSFRGRCTISCSNGALILDWIEGDPAAVFTTEPNGVWARARNKPWILEPDYGWWRMSNSVVYCYGLPLWLPLALASAAGGFAWRSELRRRRRECVGRCRKCGYDLVGLRRTATTSITLNCPECGTAVPAQPAT